MTIKVNKKRIEDFFSNFFDVKIKDLKNLTLGSLEWDSMKHVALISELEKEFKIKINMKKISDIRNYKHILKILNEKKRE